MVRYRRNLVAGGTYFFTVTVADRRSQILADHVDTLRGAFQFVQKVHPFSIDAIVILPDHFHALMTLPGGDANYSRRRRLSLIKRRFTEAVEKSGVPIPRRTNGEHVLWQRRFWEHTIRDDRDFERHVDYIHFNPVKHQIVNRVRDWPHSSFHRYVERGVLPEDWAGYVGQTSGRFGEPA